jgi:hypothetical protein
MKRHALPAILFAAIGFAWFGCKESQEVLVAPPATDVSITVEPEDAAVEEPTLFTVHATSALNGLSSVSIDFTGDGKWDETQELDAPSVAAAFSYVYPAVGGFTVRAEARDGNGVATLATLFLSVGEARRVPVSYLMLGSSPQDGVCSAHGPPALSLGVSTPLGGELETGVRRPLGTFAHGARISLSQMFDQWPYANGQDVLYSCQYSMRFIAGEPPNEVPFRLGTCTTSSRETPVRLTCIISLEGIVP